MRGAILMAAVTAASIVTAVATSSAQSSYSYPWCRRTPNNDDNVTFCFFLKLPAVHDDADRARRLLLLQPRLS